MQPERRDETPQPLSCNRATLVRGGIVVKRRILPMPPRSAPTGMFRAGMARGSCSNHAFPWCVPALVTMLLGCGGRPSAAPGEAAPPPAKAGYFGTEAAHAAFLPRSDAYCASAVTPNPWEPRPDTEQANHNVPPPPHNWSVENYWTLWRDKRTRSPATSPAQPRRSFNGQPASGASTKTPFEPMP